MTTIKDLSQVELLEIFSHYIKNEGHEKFSRNIPRVCKDWNELSSDSLLWRNVSTDNWNYLQHLSQRGLLYNTKSLKCDRYPYKSYSEVDISAVLKNIRNLKALFLTFKTVSGNAIMAVAKHCPHIESLHLMIFEPSSMTPHEWNQFLAVCGPTLKHLDLTFYRESGHQHLLSGIASKCPLLEKLVFFLPNTNFPITELREGCPKLKELKFRDCDLITDGRNESLGCGFQDLKKFSASFVDFAGWDISDLLKDSISLEYLKLRCNRNFVFSNIVKIPSNLVRFLSIKLTDPDENLEVLRETISKWHHTLSFLELRGWKCDISYFLERLLQNNPDPPLKSLAIDNNIDLHFLEKFVQKCHNLIHLKIDWTDYEGREKIKEAVEVLMKKREELAAQ